MDKRITAEKEKRIQRRIHELEVQWDILSEKIERLRLTAAVETHVDEKLRLEMVIASAENDREKTELELDHLNRILELGEIDDETLASVFLKDASAAVLDLQAQKHELTVSQGLNTLTKLIQSPEVWNAVVIFRTDLEATGQQIHVLSDYKHLHDLFQELENLYRIVDSESKYLLTDQTAWEGLMLHEPELQSVIASLLDVADDAGSVIGDARWKQQLSQAGQDLRSAVECFDQDKLQSVMWSLHRVLDREPSRINTRLVEAASALRLANLVKVMASVRDEVIGSELDREAGRLFADSVDALVDLDGRLSNHINDHDHWQEIDDELSRVEANMGKDTSELELAWPDLCSMMSTLCGDSMANWAVSLREVTTDLENALAQRTPTRIKMLFLRYCSQVNRRFRQVDSDLLALCRELQRIGESLDLLIRAME